jgi:mannitol 2-dehydrogenase
VFFNSTRETEPRQDREPVPGIDLDAYKNELIKRFQNPEVKDNLARLCAESSDRIRKWLVPAINERLTQGLPVDISAGIVTSWARYAQAIDEKGEPIVVVDQLRDQILESAAHQKENPLAFLENRKLFRELGCASRGPR